MTVPMIVDVPSSCARGLRGLFSGVSTGSSIGASVDL
jgi:hypothetical protein